MVSSYFEEEDLVAAMEARGFVFAGLNKNKAQRAELQGKPKFLGVFGPMWNGDGIRYEDRETYLKLSA
ncbi:MAG: hypothetical protein P4M05_28325 [Bradyrhizobium sp.]|nr:hypothetical protein [Bradyrhizobium sp.]